MKSVYVVKYYSIEFTDRLSDTCLMVDDFIMDVDR
jgi:hypothetical protein